MDVRPPTPPRIGAGFDAPDAPSGGFAPAGDGHSIAASAAGYWLIAREAR
ncbi:MAG: hypothetical protein LBF50_06170 [Azoarcus sp.]|jgi:hypothetical protein|nr:hypothetical protein [Azoarcus sp.]